MKNFVRFPELDFRDPSTLCQLACSCILFSGTRLGVNGYPVSNKKTKSMNISIPGHIHLNMRKKKCWCGNRLSNASGFGNWMSGLKCANLSLNALTKLVLHMEIHTLFPLRKTWLRRIVYPIWPSCLPNCLCPYGFHASLPYWNNIENCANLEASCKNKCFFLRHKQITFF